MKYRWLVILLTFVLFVHGSSISAQTNDQLFNRAAGFIREWNSIVDIYKSLSGESEIRVLNYMLGFAESAGKVLEYLNNLTYNGGVWNYEIDFFFKQKQRLIPLVGGNTSNFRYYYYDAGGNRAAYGTTRFGISDFRE